MTGEFEGVRRLTLDEMDAIAARGAIGAGDAAGAGLAALCAAAA